MSADRTLQREMELAIDDLPRWAFAQTGYGAGFALYMAFGLLSA